MLSQTRALTLAPDPLQKRHGEALAELAEAERSLGAVQDAAALRKAGEREGGRGLRRAARVPSLLSPNPSSLSLQAWNTCWT